MKVAYAGGPLYDATRAEMPVDLRRPPIVLAFDPEPGTISLDEESYALGIRLLTGWFPREAARISVSDERGVHLGSATVGASGLAHLDIATKDLAGPGPGELRVTVEEAAVAVSPLVALVERRARVELVPATPTVRGVAEDGIAIDVDVRWRRGVVPNGSLEARLFNRDPVVGAGSVRGGKGRVVVTFSADGADRAQATLHFLPDGPWWQAGDRPWSTCCFSLRACGGARHG